MFDRWTHRPGGASGPSARPLDQMYMQQEIRAQRMDARSRVFNGEDIKPKIKVERFDDDFRREGRRLERVSRTIRESVIADMQGMEGGEDEELDYDVNEDFQDDEDNNNFHRNEEDEEEQKRIDVSVLISARDGLTLRNGSKKSSSWPMRMWETGLRSIRETNRTMISLETS